MLASPVFAPSLWQASTRSRYPLFSCVMLQTRDLLCWLAVTLGLIRSEQRMKLLEVLSTLAMLEAQQRRERTFGDPSVLPELRAKAIDAVTQAVRLHAACNARRHGEATAAEVVDEGTNPTPNPTPTPTPTPPLPLPLTYLGRRGGVLERRRTARGGE